MIVVTVFEIPGKRVVRTLGLVRGNTVRARHLGKDLLAMFRNVVGGEVHEYTKLLAESMAVGEVAEVRLNSGEPLENVPRSLREEGHEVLSLEPEAAGTSAVHILRFRRR